MGDVHVAFTIPGWVWWALLAYYAVGLALVLPLLFVQARYISPRRRGRDLLRSARWRWALLFAAGWPVGVWATAGLVRRYGWHR